MTETAQQEEETNPSGSTTSVDEDGGVQVKSNKSAPEKKEEPEQEAQGEDTQQADSPEEAGEPEASEEVSFEEAFGDSIERLFKKCLWDYVPQEYFHEDRNLPKTEYKDIYYAAVERQVGDLVERFKAGISKVTGDLENAEQAVEIREKIERALQSGNHDLIKELAAKVDEYDEVKVKAE